MGIRGRLNSARLRIFAPKCTFNGSFACKGQDKKTFLCPIQDARFTGLLDFYCEGGVWEKDAPPGEFDPNAVPRLKSIEIACWFDNDFTALDSYCAWKGSGKLNMTPAMCRQFKVAWARYYVRMRPLNQRKPKWLKGESSYQGVSLRWARDHGLDDR